MSAKGFVVLLLTWFRFMARGLPQGHPPEGIAGPDFRPYEGKQIVNNPLIRPAFLGGGGHSGGWAP